MTTTATVTGKAAGKRMTLAEVREFVARCEVMEIPEDTAVEVSTRGFSPVGIKTITAAPSTR